MGVDCILGFQGEEQYHIAGGAGGVGVLESPGCQLKSLLFSGIHGTIKIFNNGLKSRK